MNDNYISNAKETIKELKKKRKELEKYNKKSEAQVLEKAYRFLEIYSEILKTQENKMLLNCVVDNNGFVFDIIDIIEGKFMALAFTCSSDMKSVIIASKGIQEDKEQVRIYKLI